MSKVSPSNQAASVKKKAVGSSFYLAMRLMPKRERDAMFAIYAFCRRVDDIADDGIGTRAERYERLEAWRCDLDALYEGQKPQRVAFLAPVVAQFGLRKEDFFTILDGMEMDVAEDIVAPALATLDLYCERVASAVGRLSIKVFGMEEGPGFALAHHLGRALQLTNILRDIDEDADVGRLYLPREYLFAAGFKSLDPRMVVSDPRVDGVCRALAQKAHEHYEKADAILAKKPKGRIATPRLMGSVYSEILKATEAQGFAPPRKRVSLSRGKLVSVLLRVGFG
ncbi:MAG TPA: presqualene diphosphate synthase HpnD [Rhizomicrobium sp.]|jgi:presqualene diphosphate synthase|nr:presqualene diphosphate synthase HpnD [Rhizomicrobium sp.]